jgi:hypothetical protein
MPWKPSRRNDGAVARKGPCDPTLDKEAEMTDRGRATPVLDQHCEQMQGHGPFRAAREIPRLASLAEVAAR